MDSVIKSQSYLGRRSGFTLVELLVVIAFLAILFSMVALKLDVFGDTENEIAQRELKMIRAAIMGDEKTQTGFIHETRTGDPNPSYGLTKIFKVPPHVSILVDKTALMEYLEITSELHPAIVWDPNHRRGYRPGGYLRGDGQEMIGTTLFDSLTDPWGAPYLIRDHETQDARIVSIGPDKKLNTTDDLSLHLFKVQ